MRLAFIDKIVVADEERGEKITKNKKLLQKCSGLFLSGLPAKTL
jgi:hypothetical protein